MNLLEQVIEACGGMRRWAQVERFTAHLSIQGALLTRKGRAGMLTDIVVEGCLRRQVVQIPGFTGPDRRAYYHPLRVAIERSDGAVLVERRGPGSTFDPYADREWDDLEVASYGGFWSWNVLTEPFGLTRPDLRTEELPAFIKDDETWRRLKVTAPRRFAPTATRIFYFDPKGLQRRVDHDPLTFGGAAVAQHCWAHHEFSGLMLPTLHRCSGVDATGTILEDNLGPDIELFDVTYE